LAKLSMLQVPKSREFMECIKPFDFSTLVYTDFDALEMKVAAHFTRDASLMKLYGPGAKPNDVHAFNAAGMRLFSEEIRKYYDPDNPTPEGIAAVKKHCGPIRDLVKTAGYGMIYGAQPPRLYSELRQAGYDITMADAEAIFTDYWDTYKGSVLFGEFLRKEMKKNGGFILNGRGRPMCIPPPYRVPGQKYPVDLSKDCFSRFVQCLAADTLVLTNHGPKAIIDVTTEDLLWDGVEWVTHKGLTSSGIKKTMSLYGVRLTHDHKVLTHGGFTQANGISNRDTLARAPATWSQVWGLCRYITVEVAKELKDLCRCAMPSWARRSTT